MQVTFSAPSIAPSAATAPAPADQPTAAPGGIASSFASLLDSHSDRTAQSSGVAVAGKATAKGTAPVAPDMKTAAAIPAVQNCEVAAPEPVPEVATPVADDKAIDWSRLAGATVIGQPVPSPVALPVPPLPSAETPPAPAPQAAKSEVSPIVGFTTPAEGVGSSIAAAIFPPETSAPTPQVNGPRKGRSSGAANLSSPTPDSSAGVPTPVGNAVSGAAPQPASAAPVPQVAPVAAVVPSPSALAPVFSAPVEPGATLAQNSDAPAMAVPAASRNPAAPVVSPLPVPRAMAAPSTAVPVAPGVSVAQTPDTSSAAEPAPVPPVKNLQGRSGAEPVNPLSPAWSPAPAAVVPPAFAAVPAAAPDTPYAPAAVPARPIPSRPPAVAPVSPAPVAVAPQSSDTPVFGPAVPPGAAAAAPATPPPIVIGPALDQAGVPLAPAFSPDNPFPLSAAPMVSADTPALFAEVPVPRGRGTPSWRVTEQARATGAQIILQNPAATLPSAAVTPSGPDAATNPVASPFVSMPTLAQMLVETAVVNTPRPAPSGPGKTPAGSILPAVAVPVPAAPPVAAGLVVPMAVEVSDAPPSVPLAVVPPSPETVPASANNEADVPVASEEGQPAATLVRGLREILAATPGKSGRVEPSPRKEGATQNFLPVEKQRVGELDPEIGMSGAKRTQPMLSQPPALSSADAALDVFELPGAATPAASAGAANMLKQPVEVGSSRSFSAVAAVREVMNVFEKAQENGRTQVELRLPTQGNESLRVHLDWRDGVVHARFVTQTSEMQRALSHEWESIAPRFAEKGLKFSEPSFERNGQQSDQQPGQSAFSSDQQRHPSRGRFTEADDLPEFALPTAAVPGAAPAIRRVAPRPTTTTNPSPALADARGLRVWA